MADLPAHQVRISSRAKSIRLSITAARGLVVTLPRGVNPAVVPGILQEKSDWIERSLKKMAEIQPVPENKLPVEFFLHSIGEKWQVVYKPKEARTVSLRVHASRVLLLEGKVSSRIAVQKLLRGWLREKAREILPAWLDQISQQTGLKYQAVTIRDQRTRWGSCSGRKTINLNQKILFLPPTLVEYILVHELCHTVHMSHSARFWNLVRTYLPDYETRRSELRKVEKTVPW